MPAPTETDSRRWTRAVQGTSVRILGMTPVPPSDIVGFIPKVANVDLTYKYRAFNFRVLVSYIGDCITIFSAPASPLNVFKAARTMVNFGLGWLLRPGANLFCEVSNPINAPQKRYMYQDSRLSNWAITGTLVNFGVTGRF